MVSYRDEGQTYLHSDNFDVFAGLYSLSLIHI